MRSRHFFALAPALGALLLAPSGCAQRFGEVHEAPTHVVFGADRGTLYYYLLSPEENLAFGNGMQPIAKGGKADLENFLITRSRHETGAIRLRLQPRRAVALVDCDTFYKRIALDLKSNANVTLNCSR